MKNVIFAVLLLMSSPLAEALSADVSRANAYYDAEKYKEAKYEYVRVIQDGDVNGVILYRIAYSSEHSGGEVAVVAALYATAAYYLEKEHETGNKYYQYSVDKASKAGIDVHKTDETLFSGMIDSLRKAKLGGIDTGSVLGNIAVFILDSVTGSGMVWLSAMALAVYIFAQFLSRKSRCIIVWGWWDLLILLAPGLILAFYLIHYNQMIAPIEYDAILTITFCATLLGTCILSIISNSRNTVGMALTFAIVSVLTKIVLVILVPIIVVLYVFALSSGKTDKRYRDGTKNNERTLWLGFVGIVAVVLVGALIKVDRGQDASRS